jgi:hypothetical protein
MNKPVEMTAELLATQAEENRNRSVYEPDQPGRIFPQRPVFKDHASERQYRKTHLVAACRAFAQHHLDYGATRSFPTSIGPTPWRCISPR